MLGSAGKQIAFVNVTEREQGVAYYRDVLGLELASSDDFGDLFSLGSANLRVTAMPDFKPSAHPILGWEIQDLRAAMDALVAKGVEFIVYPGFGQDERGVWTSPGGDTRLAWFADPDGNVLVLSQG